MHRKLWGFEIKVSDFLYCLIVTIQFYINHSVISDILIKFNPKHCNFLIQKSFDQTSSSDSVGFLFISLPCTSTTGGHFIRSLTKYSGMERPSCEDSFLIPIFLLRNHKSKLPAPPTFDVRCNPGLNILHIVLEVATHYATYMVGRACHALEAELKCQPAPPKTGQRLSVLWLLPSSSCSSVSFGLNRECN